MNWIKVSDALPDFGKKVLITYDGNRELEIGDRLLLRELLENGWTDIKWHPIELPKD